MNQMGRWFVAGRAAVGLEALCYYDLGMSNEIGAIEKAKIWPLQYVKDRIHSTYVDLAGSIGLIALSTLTVARTPALMNFMTGSWVTIGAIFAAMTGAGMLVQSISYEQSPGPKHLAWMLHSGCSCGFSDNFGGALLLRAAWYSTGIMRGLSTVAMCAPSEKFLNIGAPLGVGWVLSLHLHWSLCFFLLLCDWCHSVLSGNVWWISSFQHVPSI